MDIRVGYGMSRNRGCYPMLSLRSSSGISAGLDPRPTAGLKMQRTQTEFIDRPPGTGSRIYLSDSVCGRAGLILFKNSCSKSPWLKTRFILASSGFTFFITLLTNRSSVSGLRNRAGTNASRFCARNRRISAALHVAHTALVGRGALRARRSDCGCSCVMRSEVGTKCVPLFWLPAS